MNKLYITTIIVLVYVVQTFSQDVYKTPSGKKYHLESCRMVENVSKKVLNHSDLNKLTPCKICKPPVVSQLKITPNTKNKAVGESSSVRCKGFTKRGTRCKHWTKMANGYCYQHTKQSSKPRAEAKPSANSTSVAQAKSGKDKRKVKTGECCEH